MLLVFLYRGINKPLNKHTQTIRPGTTTCRRYKYLFRTAIEPATRQNSRPPTNETALRLSLTPQDSLRARTIKSM